MKLLDYHRVHNEERAGWDTAQMEAAVRAQDATFPERIADLAPAELCRVWLDATAEQRVLIRSRIDRDRVIQLGRFRVEARAKDSAESLRLALASLAIADLTATDAREAIMSLDALLTAAHRIHADWAALMREQIALAGPALSALMQDHFRNRPA